MIHGNSSIAVHFDTPAKRPIEDDDPQETADDGSVDAEEGGQTEEEDTGSVDSDDEDDVRVKGMTRKSRTTYSLRLPVGLSQQLTSRPSSHRSSLNDAIRSPGTRTSNLIVNAFFKSQRARIPC